MRQARNNGDWSDWPTIKVKLEGKSSEDGWDAYGETDFWACQDYEAAVASHCGQRQELLGCLGVAAVNAAI